MIAKYSNPQCGNTSLILFSYSNKYWHKNTNVLSTENSFFLFTSGNTDKNPFDSANSFSSWRETKGTAELSIL